MGWGSKVDGNWTGMTGQLVRKVCLFFGQTMAMALTKTLRFVFRFSEFKTSLCMSIRKPDVGIFLAVKKRIHTKCGCPAD